jgi:hypothetical protein
MNKPRLIVGVSKDWLGGSFMVSALCLIAFMKAFGNHSPLPYVFGAVIFLTLLGFGVWVFHGDARFLSVLALWLRIGWRKPIYDAGKHRAFALWVEKSK